MRQKNAVLSSFFIQRVSHSSRLLKKMLRHAKLPYIIINYKSPGIRQQQMIKLRH